MTANCPTCRASFAIGMFVPLRTTRTILNAITVTPDLEYIPEKYHRFIMPSIRRVYLDIDPNATEDSEKEQLRQQLALMEQQNRALEKKSKAMHRDNCMLMDKCEVLLNTSNVHAVRERHQRLEKERLITELMEVKKKYNALKGKYKCLKETTSTYVSHPRPVFTSKLTRLYRAAAPETLRPKRKMRDLPSLLAESVDITATSFAEESRAMAPLPKRRRMELPSCYDRTADNSFTGLPSFVHMPISAPLMFPPPPVFVRRAPTPYHQTA